MQVDWLTVAAQIVNFLVLVWLLQRFLYRPITEAMARREARIAEREAETYRKRQAELERRRAQMLAEAEAAADAARKALETDARATVEQRKEAWLQQLADQRAEFLRDLRQSAARHFYALARRVLGDLADAELEAQIIRVFVRQLDELDAPARDKIAAEARKAGNTVTIRSRFDIAAQDQARITEAVHHHILDGAEVSYRADPAMGAGLELKAGGQTVSWSLDSYLDGLESRLAGELREERPAAGPGATP